MIRSRFVDIHLLHFVPAANLNRDENNEPKTLELGGTTRGMVSSQSWKHELRKRFEEAIEEYAARTRMLPPLIAARLQALGWPDELAAYAAAQLVYSAKTGGLKHNKKEGHRTQAMVFIPDDVPDTLMALCVEHRAALEQAHALTDAKKRAEPVLPTKRIQQELIRRTVSISFLGRMLAEIPEGHVEAAVQMAPAFTVNACDPMPDFFTAVESWPQSGEHGSAHLDAAYLTAGVFYRYITINITDLVRNLDGRADVQDLVELFLAELIFSLPQAKKTSTAPHTLPDLVHYVVRDRRPVSYAPAFERPVRPAPGGGHLEPARQALVGYAEKADRLIGTRHRVAHGHAGAMDTPVKQLGPFHASFEDLAAACAAAAFATPDRPVDAPGTASSGGAAVSTGEAAGQARLEPA